MHSFYFVLYFVVSSGFRLSFLAFDIFSMAFSNNPKQETVTQANSVSTKLSA